MAYMHKPLYAIGTIRYENGRPLPNTLENQHLDIYGGPDNLYYPEVKKDIDGAYEKIIKHWKEVQSKEFNRREKEDIMTMLYEFIKDSEAEY